MGFFFGSSRKNNALSSSSSKAVNNKKISHQKKKKRITRDAQPQQDLLPLDDLIEKPESTLTFDPSDSESEEGSCKLTTKCTSDDDDESEILVDELSRGTPKYYGENESHDQNGVGAALAVNNTKVVLTGKLPMSIVTVNTKAANEEMSVVSSLSKNSMSSHSSQSSHGNNRQSFSQMRKEAPTQHLFKIPPKGQPPKQKNNLLKYTQSTKAAMASEVKGYLRYVAKGAEENDRSIYST